MDTVRLLQRISRYKIRTLSVLVYSATDIHDRYLPFQPGVKGSGIINRRSSIFSGLRVFSLIIFEPLWGKASFTTSAGVKSLLYISEPYYI